MFIFFFFFVILVFSFCVYHLNTLYARQSKLPIPWSEEPKGLCEGISWGKQIYWPIPVNSRYFYFYLWITIWNNPYYVTAYRKKRFCFVLLIALYPGLILNEEKLIFLVTLSNNKSIPWTLLYTFLIPKRRPKMSFTLKYFLSDFFCSFRP